MIPRPAEITAVLVAAAISKFGPAATANALSSQELLLFRLRRTHLIQPQAFLGNDLVPFSLDIYYE